MSELAAVLLRRAPRVLLACCVTAVLSAGHAGAVTLTFRQDQNGYAATQDTFLQQNPPSANTDNGAAAAIGWDGDDPAGSGFDQLALLRFDGIVGSGPGQIPPGSQITSATLTYVVFDVGDTGELHDLLVPWTEASTFSSFCGSGCDGSQWGAGATAAPAAAAGTVSVNVTASVQAWAGGAANHGWIVLPTGPGGVDVRSSEHATVGERPLLTVVYGEGGPTAGIVRQPYLQLGTPTTMTIVWRTDAATDSRVRYGASPGSLTQTADVPGATTDHVVTVTGLTPGTRYYYDVGSTTALQAGGTSEHYFETSPAPGPGSPFRAWVVGDSGTNGVEQRAVRDAMLAYTGSNRPDLYLHVGDIAYTSGTDQEFTENHFAVYQDILRHTPLWPTLGNHEGQRTTSGQPGASSGPYYDAFVLPGGGEAGGQPSGTEAYYSFDYGNTHFISLNSYQVSRSASGPMAQWLQADLAATDQQWIVAFWHHPPYSRGTHNSDTEIELREMRENILPLLEAGGVDLVLSGHSHTYERSYLIDGTYSTPTPSFATLEAQGHIVDDGDGRPAGDGAYQKPSGVNPHQGAVYVVAGHGGASLGGSLGHPVMVYSEVHYGSCILDVDATTMSLVNLRSTGVVTDSFTIVKGPIPPRVVSTAPPKFAVVGALPSVQVTFDRGVTGVDAGDLTVNGAAATSVAPTGSDVYLFTGFPAPPSGAVDVVLAPGGIAALDDPGLLFGGDSWAYTIDTTPPRVTSESPERDSRVSVLGSITVNFSKPVVGVDAGDLTVGGSPATDVQGVADSSGPFRFSGFAPPPVGLVSVSLAPGGIEDEQGRPFAGDSWEYTLRPGLVINEFLASNNTTVTDEFGEFDDYVEIYNPANEPVDMGGMYLTDVLGFRQEYRIPEGTVVPARGHVLFWCDSQPQQGPRHTNFNLSRTGEDIGLFGTQDEGFPAIDTLTYGVQTTDVPLGRFPDGQTGYVSMPATPATANTVLCSGDAECAGLSDACNTGRCVSGRCTAEPANEGGACDDGIACRGPDTCSGGVCDNGPDLCTGGQVCDLTTGLCEVPAVDPLPIDVGETWRYFKGTAEPPTDWTAQSFDDSSWLTGPSGFGYGPDCPAQRGTTLADMQQPPSAQGYMSVYLRKTFQVDDPALVTSLTLTIDYDDAFVAYVNGIPVGGNNVPGSPPPHTQPATADHECSGGSPNPNPAQTVSISPSELVAGVNVIAIQAHNVALNSSDFTVTPSLASTQTTGCSTGFDCDDGNPCTDDLCAAGACSHPLDDTNACSDGVACTADACSGGTCVGTSTCPAGESCNPGTGLCGASPQSATFQQGLGGYAGTVDTFLHAGLPDTNNGAATTLIVDGPPPVADERQTLLRFDGLFASAGGPIPDGAAITSATLTLTITNPSATGAQLHRMLVPWASGSTWNSLTGGVARDGLESVAAADATGVYNGAVPAAFAVDVTASLSAWSAGAANLGWVLAPPAGGSDSWQFDSAEGAVTADRPRLVVQYLEDGGPQARMLCAPAATTVAPGGSVPVEVRLENLGGLPGIRGYQTQIAITRTSGAGTLSVPCPSGISVDETRTDDLFEGVGPTWPAVNCGLARATNSITSGSVPVGPGQVYLSSATLVASADAAEGSTFEVAVVGAPDSALADAAGDPVPFASGDRCTITVAGSCPLPCDDGNVCTTDACVAGVCSSTPSGACGVGGTVRYYRDHLASAEPSAKGVPSVGIDASSDAVADDISDTAGAYAIGGLAGSVVVETLPKLGSPRAADDNGAITSFDAALIAQHAVGAISLSPNQRIGGDVSGNGQVTSFDAAKVSQYAVQLIDHFDVALSLGSDWRFLRCDTYSDATNHDCAGASFIYAPLAQPETADFYAVLFGDVSGNWAPAGMRAISRAASDEERLAESDRDRAALLRARPDRPARAVPAGAAVVSLEGLGGLSAGERRTVRVMVDGADGIESLDVTLRYDERALSIVGVSPVALADGWAVTSHDAPGLTRVALYGVDPMRGSGAVLEITVEAQRRLVRRDLQIEATANEGRIRTSMAGTGRVPRRATSTRP